MDLTITLSEATELEAALYARILVLEGMKYDGDLMLQGKDLEEVNTRIGLMRCTLNNLIRARGF